MASGVSMTRAVSLAARAAGGGGGIGGARASGLASRSVASLLVLPRVVRVAGARLPSGAASYYSTPVPTIKKEDIVPAPGSKPKPKQFAVRGLLHRLNEFERVAHGFAERSGVLQMKNGCTENVANMYLRYCWARRRPYIAMNKHGDRVVVDTAPLAALEAKKADELLDAYTKLLGPSGAFHGISQVVNATDKNDTEKAIKVGQEGTNVGKAVTREPEEAFTVLVPNRSVGYKLTRALYGEFVTLCERDDPRDMALAREERALRRKSQWEDKMRLVLHKVNRDEKIKRSLPKGILDKFLAHDAARVATATAAEVATDGPIIAEKVTEDARA